MSVFKYKVFKNAIQLEQSSKHVLAFLSAFPFLVILLSLITFRWIVDDSLADPTKTDSHAELISLSNDLQLGMTWQEVDTHLSAVSERLGVIHFTDEKLIVIVTGPPHAMAKNRVPGIGFDDSDQITCLMFRVADHPSIHYMNDPDDRIAEGAEVPSDWRIQSFRE